MQCFSLTTSQIFNNINKNKIICYCQINVKLVPNFSLTAKFKKQCQKNVKLHKFLQSAKFDLFIILKWQLVTLDAPENPQVKITMRGWLTN